MSDDDGSPEFWQAMVDDDFAEPKPPDASTEAPCCSGGPDMPEKHVHTSITPEQALPLIAANEAGLIPTAKRLDAMPLPTPPDTGTEALAGGPVPTLLALALAHQDVADWLAQHDREVAAQALELAALEVRDAKTIPIVARASVAAVLSGRARNLRADAIQEGHDD